MLKIVGVIMIITLYFLLHNAEPSSRSKVLPGLNHRSLKPAGSSGRE